MPLKMLLRKARSQAVEKCRSYSFRRYHYLMSHFSDVISDALLIVFHFTT